MESELREPVQLVIDLLVRGAYKELASLTGGIRLTSSEIEEGVSDYGRTLCPLPESAYEKVRSYRSIVSQVPSWQVVVPLWTLEEGESDLSLELTVIRERNGFRVEVDGIHVL